MTDFGTKPAGLTEAQVDGKITTHTAISTAHLSRNTIAAWSKSHYNLPAVFASKLGVSAAEIPDTEIDLIGGTTLERELNRNALVFTLAASGFGLVYPGCPSRAGLNKSRVSIIYSLHVDTSTEVAVFSRLEIDDNNYIQALFETGAGQFNLAIEKVVAGVTTVLDIEDPYPAAPYAPVEFEFYADLDNDVCGVVKRGITNSSTFSSLKANTFKAAGWSLFRNALIGFQNFDAGVRTAIIYTPIVVMSN